MTFLDKDALDQFLLWPNTVQTGVLDFLVTGPSSGAPGQNSLRDALVRLAAGVEQTDD